MTTWAVVVAAGSGERYGARKQFEIVAGRPLLDWSIDVALDVCDGAVVVVPHDAVEREAARLACSVVAGGATRSESVRAGLRAVPDDASVVVVHDAARPLASRELWRVVVAALDDADTDAALPAVAVTDTVREVGGRTIDRDRFVLVQTPQAFRAAVLRRVHDAAPEGTDDASLVEAAGGRVVVVPGEPRNMKVTTADDLAMVAVFLS